MFCLTAQFSVPPIKREYLLLFYCSRAERAFCINLIYSNMTRWRETVYNVKRNYHNRQPRLDGCSKLFWSARNLIRKRFAVIELYWAVGIIERFVIVLWIRLVFQTVSTKKRKRYIYTSIKSIRFHVCIQYTWSPFGQWDFRLIICRIC